MARLQASAALLQESFEQEYRLRQCGARAAAAANLGDSARFIGGRQPSKQVAARRAAEELVDLLGEAHEPPSESPSCFTAGPWPLATSLHRQQHKNQDLYWPNWIARLVRAPP